MSPQYHFARRLVAALFALASIATGVIGGSNGAKADTPQIYNGEIAFLHGDSDPNRFDTVDALRPDGAGRHSLNAGAYPTYSFDGTRIASGFGGGISILDLATNESTLQLPNQPLSFSLSWSSDEAAFATTEGNGTGGSGIVIANADGTGKHTILADDAIETNPVFVPGTSRLVFLRSQGFREIWSVDADGTDATVLVPQAYADVIGLDVSRDASHIVYSSSGELTIANADGSDPHAIGVKGVLPRFSPDGQWVVFVRDDLFTGKGLGVARLDGSEERQLTEGNDAFPTWQARTTPLPDPPTTTSTSAPTTSTSTTSTSTTSTTLVNQPPVPRFAFKQAKPHYVIASAANSTDPDGTIVSYEWRWGDGSPASTTKQAWHQYKQSGWALIRLTVTDNNGATTTRALWYHVN